MSAALAFRPRPPEVLEDLGAARDAVDAAAGRVLTDICEDQFADVVRRAAELRSQVDALELALAAEAARRAVEDTGADTGTEEWLARLTGDRKEVLRGGVRIARLLQQRYHLTRQALTTGQIRLTQAKVIVNGLEVSADDATGAQQAEAEDRLIAKATGQATRTGTPMPPAQLRRAVRRAYDRIDTALAQRHLERSVRANNHRGETNTWMTLHEVGDGTWTGRFSIPEFLGQILKGILDKLSAPRRYGRDKDGHTVTDDVADTDTSGLSWCDKLGMAFCELIEHLPTDHLSKSVVTIMAMINLEDLVSDLHAAGVATASTGADLTAGQVRRLACEAGIVPAVVADGVSVPLDLGRTRRLHTLKQRQALAAVHDSCAIASCDRPFAWCEIHHPDPWSEGGPTNLSNALPLCGHHHRAVHNPRYRLTRHSDTAWTLHRRRRC